MNHQERFQGACGCVASSYMPAQEEPCCTVFHGKRCVKLAGSSNRVTAMLRRAFIVSVLPTRPLAVTYFHLSAMSCNKCLSAAAAAAEAVRTPPDVHVCIGISRRRLAISCTLFAGCFQACSMLCVCMCCCGRGCGCGEETHLFVCM